MSRRRRPLMGRALSRPRRSAAPSPLGRGGRFSLVPRKEVQAVPSWKLAGVSFRDSEVRGSSSAVTYLPRRRDPFSRWRRLRLAVHRARVTNAQEPPIDPRDADCSPAPEHDADGFGADADCDGTNAEVYPGAQERCVNVGRGHRFPSVAHTLRGPWSGPSSYWVWHPATCRH